MSVFAKPRLLAVYASLLLLCSVATIVCALLLLTRADFGIINARRINIVEPDGTVRLTISNRADFPGAWRHKQESPRPDRREAAGFLFMSEEGSEQGGLIWGASQLPDGTIENHSHLSFDQYEENQIFALDAGQEGKDKFSKITIADQGDYPLQEKRDAVDRIEKLPVDQRDAAWKEFFGSHRHDVARLSLGRFRDGSAGLDLCDSGGKVRLRLAVRSDGKAVLQFLDESGKVVSEFSGQKQ
jgi:hypothetical protein